MIVYGDNQRTEATQDLIARLCHDAAQLLDNPTDQWSIATRLLIQCGELAQGLLDAAFQERGCDDWGMLEEVCSQLLLCAARQNGHAVIAALQSLDQVTLPNTIVVKVPEGYAFYALYPELYARAARQLSVTAKRPILVIGLRSIGTSLGAVVAAATDSPLPLVTLRPAGHPFQRRLQIGPRLERLLLAQSQEAIVAVVDEGPGLSGSSFGAAADWLEEHGIAPEHIHFFPGHSGDLGPQASADHRRRWLSVLRHVCPFEDLLSQESSWFLEGVANADLGLIDIGGGQWRSRFYASESAWPPANLLQERRKYLYHAVDQTWMAKFAGLGAIGETKLAIGRVLSDAGFTPSLAGLRHGFLISKWLTGAQPLHVRTIPDRGAFLRRVAEYLTFRCRALPASGSSPGASPEQLFGMARFNIAQALGAEFADRFDPWRAHLSIIAAHARPILSDNRWHLWEWLLLPSGEIVKADALDHHQGHDCIGAQDPAWDLAGTAVELDLSAEELDELSSAVAHGSMYRPHPRCPPFYILSYLAFQMGYYQLSAEAHRPAYPAEAARLAARAGHYASRLRLVLS